MDRKAAIEASRFVADVLWVTVFGLALLGGSIYMLFLLKWWSLLLFPVVIWIAKYIDLRVS